MKRIAEIADSHFCEESRFDECVRLHDWIANDIRRRGADLILHGGDVFERKSNPRERLAVAKLLTDLAEIAAVVIVRGNHDAVGDLKLFEQLETKHPVVVVETAGVVYAADCAVACLGWPRRAELMARCNDVLDSEGGNQLAAEALRNVLRGMGDQIASHYGPRILLAHAMVRGSVTSTGQPLVGCDMEIGLDDLALAGADFVALGHIHKGQDWAWGKTPIVYPGSPRRTAFGEVEEKGYVIVEVESHPHNADAKVRWERVVAPATRMLLAEDEYAPGRSWAFNGLGGDGVKGAECRFRYTVDADQREAAKAAAEIQRRVLLDLGAASVKIEEVVRATTRARTPEIATATSLEDKLRVLWRAKGIDVGNDREPRLLARLAELEAA
jgi:DNA repair protein SbcD/Mre11